MPETFDKFCYLEFTQPATAESYTVLRSVSIAEGSGTPSNVQYMLYFQVFSNKLVNFHKNWILSLQQTII